MRFAVIHDKTSETNPVGVILHMRNKALFVTSQEYRPAIYNALNKPYIGLQKREGDLILRERIHFSQDNDFLEALKYDMNPPLVVKHIGDIDNDRALPTLVRKFMPEGMKLLDPIKVVPNER